LIDAAPASTVPARYSFLTEQGVARATQKGINLKQLRLVAAATVVAVFCVSASALAAPYGPPTGSSSGTAPTVFIKGNSEGSLRFEAPKTIADGEELAVVNTTNPKQVGPHTFSLVTKGSVPKTAKQRQLCFTPNHICKAIADWHGVKGNGPVKVNPVDAGPEGWSTLGSLSKEGDSWFTGTKPDTSIVQKVDFDTTAGPTRIYFICAIHPWMHGTINVLPGS
jgi:hypothetical protein